ncbi:MAG: hypothetical protein JRI45_11115 [Deltaproteobacteria bacterium]|nr:hypothetical protein [Deltaproteobacteria bacterium]MBW2069479.1 hypothetical protein [Deltaproteobacteria bacterium]
MWHYELMPESPFDNDTTFFPFEINVVFCSELKSNDTLLAKSVLPEAFFEVLHFFYRDTQGFVNSMIENYLLNKNANDKEALRNKAWDYLKSRGLVNNGNLKGSLSDIGKAIQDALKRPPKRKSQQAPKQCPICGNTFRNRGILCSHCYKKRWFAVQLLEKLHKENIGDRFNKGLLTETEKRHIAESIRPVGSRYSFSYFEKCLRELVTINKAKNWPDKKFREKIKKFQFLEL